MESSHFSSRLKNAWLLEIVSIIMSCASFAIILLVLFHFNQKPVFDWHSISLNTWVSWFSTIAKSLLLFAVSACLSQWKFIWFSQTRRQLIDFDIFDGASRGPNGSLNLLWYINTRSVASLGAFITILSLAIDPFMQSVVGLEESQTHGSGNSTSVPRALRYSKGSTITGEDNLLYADDGNIYERVQSTADFSLQSAILFGLSSSRFSISQQTTARCSGAYCKWKPYLSLSICSTCTNVTDQLIKTTTTYTTDNPYRPLTSLFDSSNAINIVAEGPVTTYGFPNGLYMDNTSDVVSLVAYSTTNRSETVTFQQNELLLWSLTSIKRPADDLLASGALSAVECGLMYCVKNYTSEVINGTLDEISPSLPLKISPGSWQPSNTSAKDPTPGQLNSKWNFTRSDLRLGDQYNISQVAINGIGTAMIDVFTNLNTSSCWNHTGATGFYMGWENLPGGDQFYPNSMQPIHESRDLDATFTGLAMSMSNSIRAGDDYQTLVLGTTNITVYKIHWQWLALPFINLLGGCFLLAFTIFYTHRQAIPIWKSSSLSTLKVGATMGRVLDENTVDGMEKKAKKTYIGPFEAFDGQDEATRGLTASKNLELQIPRKPLNSISTNGEHSV